MRWDDAVDYVDHGTEQRICVNIHITIRLGKAQGTGHSGSCGRKSLKWKIGETRVVGGKVKVFSLGFCFFLYTQLIRKNHTQSYTFP